MSRRANASGSISKRASDNAFLVRVSHDGGRTKRIVHREPGERIEAHRRRAQAVLDEMLGEIAKPVEQRERMTVADYATSVYLTSVAEGLRPDTVEGYRDVLRLYVLPHVGRIALADLHAEHVDGMDAALRDAGLSVGTRRAARAALRRVLAHAVRKGRIAAVAVDGADPIRVRDRDVLADVLTPAEVGAVVDAARGTRWEAMVALLGLLGLRRSETLALAWDAVDLDAATLTVQRALVTLDNGATWIGPPKTTSGRRTLTLTPMLVAALRARRAEQAAQQLAAGPLWAPDALDHEGVAVPLCFLDEAGRPHSSHQLSSALYRLSTAALGRRVGPHQLRHAAASSMIAQGFDAPSVAAVLGHSGPAVTLGVYSHAFRDRTALATEAIAAAIGGS